MYNNVFIMVTRWALKNAMYCSSNTYSHKTYGLCRKYHSCALKSRSKLKVAIGLRASFWDFLLHQNSSLFTVTFEEKVLTLAKSRGS